MKRNGLLTAVLLLLFAVLVLPVWFGQVTVAIPPTPISIEGKTPQDFMEQLPGGGKRLTLPVLYEVCGIPMVLVEPDGDGLKHYTKDAMKKRLTELKGMPILSNEVTKDYSMKCLKSGKGKPRIDSLPYHQDSPHTTPEAGPAREWSA